MTIASIDIGTNTVLLLIARVNLSTRTVIPLLNEYRMPRIGKGLIPGGRIAADRIDNLFLVLSEYESIIKNYNVDKTIIIATNALRVAANSLLIAQEIKKRFNWDVNIITGETEAKLAFLGAMSESNKFDNSLVIDIGGGSTELIYGNKSDIKYAKSFPLGCVNTTERFLTHSPPSPIELENLNSQVNLKFTEVKNSIAPDLTVAIAGTATTIACMVKNLREFDENIIDGSLLSLSEIRKLCQSISRLTPDKIKSIYGNVMRGREDIILAGSFILLNIMELLVLSQVMISSRGVRYGVIHYYLQNQMI